MGFKRLDQGLAYGLLQMRWALSNMIAYLAVTALLYGSQMTTQALAPDVMATAVKQYYCLGQPGDFLMGPLAEPEKPETIALHLRFRLSYHNRAMVPLIVPSGFRVANLIFNQSGATRKPSIVPYAPWVSAGDVTYGGIAKPNGHFEVIPPGGTWVPPEDRIYLKVHTGEPSNQQFELLGKKIFLRLELDHLRFDKALAMRLRKDWQSFGFLWASRVITNAIEIEIPQAPQFEDCSREYRID